MAKYTRQDILDLIEEEDVKFIRLQFTDIAGNLKNMATTVDQIDKILGGRCRFNCAAVDGFRGVGYEELFLVPDLDTFVTFPWRPQNGKVARFICDIVKPDGTPFKGSSRYILKKVIAEAEQMGYTLDVGIKHEFFLFDLDENGEPTNQSSERGGYFDIGPSDGGENTRRDMVLYLADMGIEVESSYHSDEAAQHALEMAHDNALTVADNIMTTRLVVRTVAKRHGGEKIALVGPNGAGKTTLILLLCRLYEPTHGRILLNGIDIREYDYEEYLAMFGVVFQDFKLFAMTVAENVAASEEYDEREIEEVLEKAGIWERVQKMEQGIHNPLYNVGIKGVEVSGGEAQKIAIARALYKKAPFIILDEPTSALDPMAEYEIYSSFDRLIQDRMAVYISHRMSSCRFCQRIIVLKDGQVQEQGTHEELIEKDGIYAMMWNAQAQNYQ